MLSSFKPGSELFSLPLKMFPENWTVSGYTTAWNRFDFQQYFINTATVAVITTVLTVIVSAMTGYAFAKYKAWWLKAFFVCILATTMLPTEVIIYDYPVHTNWCEVIPRRNNQPQKRPMEMKEVEDVRIAC